jgi:hypothetical protein
MYNVQVGIGPDAAELGVLIPSKPATKVQEVGHIKR